MLPLRPMAKAGVVAGGFLAAFAVAGLAVWVRVQLTQGPEAQATSGMQAFSDLLLGLVVFGTLALGPFGLALYWLRPIARFWTLLAWSAGLLVLTGPLALLVSGGLRASAGNWSLLTDVRIGLMPGSALAMAICGLFAPQGRPRWTLILAALVEGGIIAAVVLVKFVLPSLAR